MFDVDSVGESVWSFFVFSQKGGPRHDNTVVSVVRREPALPPMSDERFCRLCLIRARGFVLQMRKQRSPEEIDIIEQNLVSILKERDRVVRRFMREHCDDYEDKQDAKDDALAEFESVLTNILRHAKAKRQGVASRGRTSSRRGMAPDAQTTTDQQERTDEPSARREKDAMETKTATQSVCSVCSFVKLSQGSRKTICALCAVWQSARVSESEAAQCTRRFIEYVTVNDGHFDLTNPSAIDREAQKIVRRAERACTSVLQWFMNELASHPHCCFCNAVLAKGQRGDPVCSKHEQWFITFSEKCEPLFPEGTSMIALARETASAWQEWRGTDPNAPEAAIWGEFMQEEIQPKADEAWAKEAPKPPVVQMARKKVLVPHDDGAPAAAPTPSASTPVEPEVSDAAAEEPALVLSLSQPVHRVFTDAERNWIANNKIREKFGLTQDELPSVIGELEQYKSAHPELASRGRYSAAALFRKDVLPDLACRIIAARMSPKASASAAPPASPEEEPSGTIDVSPEDARKIRMNVELLVARLEGMKSQAAGIIQDIEKLQANLLNLQQQASS